MAATEELLTSKRSSSILDSRLLQFVNSKERERCLQQGNLKVEQSVSEIELKVRQLIEVGLVDMGRQAGLNHHSHPEELCTRSQTMQHSLRAAILHSRSRVQLGRYQKQNNHKYHRENPQPHGGPLPPFSFFPSYSILFYVKKEFAVCYMFLLHALE